MDDGHKLLLFRFRIVRALLVASLGFLKRRETGSITDYWSESDLHRLQSQNYRLKERADLLRVIYQSVEDGTIIAPAAVVIARSVLDHVLLSKAMITDLVDQTKATQYAEISLPLIQKFNSEYARNILYNEAGALTEANRLVSLLIKIVPADIAMYYCALAASNFASGIDIESDGLAKIVRELKFPPEYQQAGLSILNYFSAILEEKYPKIPVAVSIQQNRDKVTLLITLPDGSQDVIEKVLTEYGLVISGKITAQEFLPNQIRALALQQKLELAHLEIRQTRELLQMQKNYSANRIESLEQDVKNLYLMLSGELASKNDLQKGLLQIVSHAPDNELSQQLSKLVERLGNAIDQRNEQQSRVLLEDIREANPDVFTRLSLFIYQSVTSGVIGNSAYDWIKVILAGLPK